MFTVGSGKSTREMKEIFKELNIDTACTECYAIIDELWCDVAMHGDCPYYKKNEEE